MKRHILIPTDFSRNAWSTIVYAQKLYGNEKCIFYFMHSTYLQHTGSRTYITSSFIEKLEHQSLKELQELKNHFEFTDENPNHEFNIILSKNELTSAVKKAVKDYDIDLVVMGTKGRTNSLESFLGSNTIKVLNKTKECPVLVIPNEHEFVIPAQIGFPTDYNRFYDAKELTPLKTMADLFNSQIRIAHVDVEKKLSKLQEYNMTMLQTNLTNYKPSLHRLPDYTSKSKAIVDFIQYFTIEMLALVKYKHSLIEAILNEPVIKKLTVHPKVPILVLPA